MCQDRTDPVLTAEETRDMLERIGCQYDRRAARSRPDRVNGYSFRLG